MYMHKKVKINDPLLIRIERKTAAELESLKAEQKKSSKENLTYNDVIIFLLEEYKRRQP